MAKGSSKTGPSKIGPSKTGKAARKPAAGDTADLRRRIVDHAMDRAAEGGWEQLSLRHLADDLGLSLDILAQHFRDQDAIADAWFQRAWQAMLAPQEDGFFERPARERLAEVMLRWFDALAPYRRVTAQMICAKLWYAHPHHYVPMVFNLSRTIQWVREAAGLHAGGRRRQIEEIGLTALFLAVLRVWCRDESDDQARTRAYLEKRLGCADKLMAGLFGGVGPAARPAAA